MQYGNKNEKRENVVMIVIDLNPAAKTRGLMVVVGEVGDKNPALPASFACREKVVRGQTGAADAVDAPATCPPVASI